MISSQAKCPLAKVVINNVVRPLLLSGGMTRVSDRPFAIFSMDVAGIAAKNPITRILLGKCHFFHEPLWGHCTAHVNGCFTNALPLRGFFSSKIA